MCAQRFFSVRESNKLALARRVRQRSLRFASRLRAGRLGRAPRASSFRATLRCASASSVRRVVVLLLRAAARGVEAARDDGRPDLRGDRVRHSTFDVRPAAELTTSRRTY